MKNMSFLLEKQLFYLPFSKHHFINCLMSLKNHLVLLKLKLVKIYFFKSCNHFYKIIVKVYIYYIQTVPRWPESLMGARCKIVGTMQIWLLNLTRAIWCNVANSIIGQSTKVPALRETVTENKRFK